MPDNLSKKKISVFLPNNPVNQDAGTRGSDGVDTPTCFGIPGSGLPRRHCNTDFQVTVAVSSDMQVYAAAHSGRIYQNVFGRTYECRIYAAPQSFSLYIPNGSTGWKDAQFLQGSKQLSIIDEGSGQEGVTLLAEGSLKKTYQNTVQFDWRFGDCFQMADKGEYYENDITKDMWYELPNHNGGFSKANSAFHNMGNMKSDFWRNGLSQKVEIDGVPVEDPDGVLWLSGGILYGGGSVIDSDITAPAVPILVKGLKEGTFYYPGDIQKGDKRMSLNRPEGYFLIHTPSFDADWLDWQGPWRDVKNTEDDRAVEEGVYQNTGFRLEGGETWVRLILSGEGGASTEDTEGIGADDDGSGSGCCCCGGRS